MVVNCTPVMIVGALVLTICAIPCAALFVLKMEKDNSLV